MDIKKIKDLTIAKEKFDPFDGPKLPLDYEKWVKYIENNKSYYTWAEDTENGKIALANIDKVPEWAKVNVLASYNKGRCYAEYNDKKLYYDVIVTFYEELNKVQIDFEKTISKKDLQKAFDMAKSLNALLLHNRKEIITENMINQL